MLDFSICQGHQPCDCFEKCYLKSMQLKYTHVVFCKYLQHLKQQQEGLSHLISIIKDDLEDIKLIEHGLNESIPIRGGVFSWRVACCWARTEHIIQVHGSPSKAKTGEVKWNVYLLGVMVCCLLSLELAKPLLSFWTWPLEGLYFIKLYML